MSTRHLLRNPGLQEAPGLGNSWTNSRRTGEEADVGQVVVLLSVGSGSRNSSRKTSPNPLCLCLALIQSGARHSPHVTSLGVRKSPISRRKAAQRTMLPADGPFPAHHSRLRSQQRQTDMSLKAGFPAFWLSTLGDLTKPSEPRTFQGTNIFDLSGEYDSSGDTGSS